MNPGSEINKPPAKRKPDVMKLMFPNPQIYLSKARLIAIKPRVHEPISLTISGMGPRRIIAGDITKKKGKKYLATPKRIAATPVFMGLASAIAAAGKADKATGGVM